jgi:hypothetical protein
VSANFYQAVRIFMSGSERTIFYKKRETRPDVRVGIRQRIVEIHGEGPAQSTIVAIARRERER